MIVSTFLRYSLSLVDSSSGCKMRIRKMMLTGARSVTMLSTVLRILPPKEKRRIRGQAEQAALLYRPHQTLVAQECSNQVSKLLLQALLITSSLTKHPVKHSSKP